MLSNVRWPTVVVGGLVVAGLAAVAIWGRQWGLGAEAHESLLAFMGAGGTMLLAAMRSALGQDERRAK